VQDLEARLIRICANNPDRLREDPVRVLRAARFCAQFSCRLEEHTAGALKLHADRCSREAGGRRLRLALAAHLHPQRASPPPPSHTHVP
jgi:tRNA nucleotidyltransferase/poly(A) polymerase